IERWGKLDLPGKAKLNSRLNELRRDRPGRSSRYFEVCSSSPLFGEALAFYTRRLPDESTDNLVVYHPIVGLCTEYRQWRGKWGTTVKVARVLSIVAVIGIWVGPESQDVHILRKHPGLDLLSAAECGLVSGENNLDDLEVEDV
ncbi:hypothetical protein FIBSPDRAFT_762968, partial [Athelia psychrophila]